MLLRGLHSCHSRLLAQEFRAWQLEPSVQYILPHGAEQKTADIVSATTELVAAGALELSLIHISEPTRR
eukprot:8840840-Lingulodinium_polyedra.AAC.1